MSDQMGERRVITLDCSIISHLRSSRLLCTGDRSFTTRFSRRGTVRRLCSPELSSGPEVNWRSVADSVVDASCSLMNQQLLIHRNVNFQDDSEDNAFAKNHELPAVGLSTVQQKVPPPPPPPHRRLKTRGSATPLDLGSPKALPHLHWDLDPPSDLLTSSPSCC